jgi:DNA polymerase III delta subunit
LEDITGKPLSAVDVFTLSIKALVDHLLSMLKKQGKLIHNDEVQWILTSVSSTNKTDRHDIAEILLKLALNTIKPLSQSSM